MSEAELLEKLRNIDSVALANLLNPNPGKVHELSIFVPKPTMEQKVRAAAWISGMGIHQAGVDTQARLMWPLTKFSELDVSREAARTLGSVLVALVGALPPQQIEQIWIDQGERLSFVDEFASLDDKSRHRAE
ncbi:hypothetical protein H5162_03750 [Pseudoalteromonas sp. SR41-8]|uniref:hypothetical protein n=1 Tax=Pseudoalteromonas sp. SR41-8 TaxID=2760946 RepID=UPI001603D139|nr:hypothetical protein [Pseudoalteromonas sp. SR41-8]MBB1308558.1 hypothetical protein [Pseudoalteromonas sp. SR41-8]